MVGIKPYATGTANVFRARFGSLPGAGSDTDFWIDTQSKQLVAIHSPGSDKFDPSTDADRDKPAEPQFSTVTGAGHIESEIVLDAKLDSALFSLDPPSGFELETPPRPTITEDEMVEYLGAWARFNGGQFPDRAYADDSFSKAFNTAAFKDRKDQSDIERKMIELHDRYLQREIYMSPVTRFVEDHTVPKSFYYIGTGVKIGQADRFVCWYKLKSTGQYRALFGDLTVKDVSPKDLPISVQPLIRLSPARQDAAGPGQVWIGITRERRIAAQIAAIRLVFPSSPLGRQSKNRVVY